MEGSTTSDTEVSGGYLPLAFVSVLLGEIEIRGVLFYCEDFFLNLRYEAFDF